MKPFQGIIKFNEDRNLVKEFTIENEYNMLAEELEEMATAIATEDEYELADSLSDIIVVAVGTLYKLGYQPELALKQTVKEILSRKGSLDENGKFQKDRDQDPATLYKADYNLAKR
jgi:NTP pyrophosphatase (non-canonical NTP hydrolase)